MRHISEIIGLIEWIRNNFESRDNGWVLFDHPKEISASSRYQDGIKIYSEEELYDIYFNKPEQKEYLEGNE